MAKALRHHLQYLKQQAREPEDVSHHFRGKRCITECEGYIVDDRLLLRAIAYEWLRRNTGIRTIAEVTKALGFRPRMLAYLGRELEVLARDGKITLSKKYQMLSRDWFARAEITVNDWLKQTGFEQANDPE